MILWTYYDYYVRWILWTSWGTTHGTDQWIGGKPEGWSTSESRCSAAASALTTIPIVADLPIVFFNKSGYKLSPYLNAAWKPRQPQGLLQLIRSWVVITPDTQAECQGRQVDLAPWPERIDDSGAVIFSNNGRPEYSLMRSETIKPDVVIFCTGYTHEYPFLGPQRSSPCYWDGKLVRDIWPRDDPSIGFIGFVRPNLGAIPPLTEFQAQLWVLNLLAPERVGGGAALRPEDEPHYRLFSAKNARIRYGVDHESYAYQLALDMGSAPSFSDVLRLGFTKGERSDAKSNSGSWYKLPLTWALGANFNTKFRLLGPWQWDGALEVMNTELWDTVARRQMFFGHCTLSIVPMLIFGPMSLVIFLYASLCEIFQSIGRGLRTTEARVIQKSRLELDDLKSHSF